MVNESCLNNSFDATLVVVACMSAERYPTMQEHAYVGLR